MKFKPAIWFPIATILSIINVVAVGFAARDAEPLHAATHAALGVAFGLWAMRLRQRGGAGAAVSGGEQQGRIEALEDDMMRMREALVEAQERLDFTERLLTQEREGRRVGPER